MKSSEFIRKAVQAGWSLSRQGKGSHAIYEKDGVKVSIPDHGSKEMKKGIEMALKKKMGLK